MTISSSCPTNLVRVRAFQRISSPIYEPRVRIYTINVCISKQLAEQNVGEKALKRNDYDGHVRYLPMGQYPIGY